MVNDLFYVFAPTAALLDAIKLADERYLAGVSVWTTKEHDRVGQEHTKAEIEAAFWTLFLARLVGEEPEPAALRQLRATCLHLGFEGCWSVFTTRQGGSAAELIEEAVDAEPFVRQHVLQVDLSGILCAGVA
jgi:hypothetical protein